MLQVSPPKADYGYFVGKECKMKQITLAGSLVLPLTRPVPGQQQTTTTVNVLGDQAVLQESADRNRSLWIRHTGKELPLQIFWTWLSGVEIQPSSRYFDRTPSLQVLDSVGGFLAAIFFGHVALKLGGLWLLAAPLMSLIALSRARKCHMTIVHQAVHDQLFQVKNIRVRKALNRFVAELIGVLIWIPDFAAYRASHAISHHNHRETATPKDQDGKEVFTLGSSGQEKIAVFANMELETATPLDQDGKEVFLMGFLPGRPREYYWRLIWKIVRSPKFYIADLVKRARYSLIVAPWYRRLASAVFLCGLIFIATSYSAWPTLVLLYVIPVFPLFRLSGLLQVLSEHMWGTQMHLIGNKDRVPLVCQGRFLFDEVPSIDLPLSRWLLATLKWWIRVPYHLVIRLCVLCGDLQVHNDHHFHPRSPEWTNAISACSRRMTKDTEGLYTHSWSMEEALDRVFTAMAAEPPLDSNWLKELRD
jgi:hypothetical protein